MEVKVTARHIAHGDKGHNFHNPIALALQERDPYAVCTPTAAHLSEQVITLPYVARVWLESYNRGADVSPFSFVI